MRFINDIIKPFIRPAMISSMAVVLGLLLSLSAEAQGWEKYYGDDGDEEATAIIQTIDEGYAIVGRKSTNTSGFEIYVIRTDVDGTVLWENTYGSVDQADDFGYDIIETPDNGFVIVGETNLGGPFGNRDALLLKIDEKGEQVWFNYYGTESNDRGFSVKNTQDGGLILSGSSETETGETEVYLVKTDTDGIAQWEEIGLNPSLIDATGQDIVETPEGEFIIVGSIGENSDSDVLVVKVNNIGQYLFHTTYGGNENDVAYNIIKASESDTTYVVAGKKGNNSDFYGLKILDETLNFDFDWITSFGVDTISEQAIAVVETNNGGFAFAGFTQTTPADLQATLLIVDNDGNNPQIINYGRSGLDAANGIVKTPRGGFVLAGFTTDPSTFFPQDILLIKTDEVGEYVFTNHIVGNVYYDLDNDCQDDGISEAGIKRWVVKAVGANTFYDVTDENGDYDIPVEVGNYQVSVVRPNEYYQAFCQPMANANFSAPYDSLIRNFAINPDIVCTDLEVDVSTTFVEACEEATYTVNYCNHGTVAASDIEIELILSNNLEYVSVSGTTLSTVDDSLYVFEVNDLEIGECASFTVTVEASCDALLAEAHCIKAHITPDDICLPEDPNWDGSSLAVNGYCDNDSVRFQITNVGVDIMDQELNYIVIEDIVMGLYDTPNQLAPNETHEIAIPANGATQRLIVKQSTGHPGNSTYPTVAVEGCVAGGGTDYSTGFHTQLPEDDADHFLATDCQENIPSTFDANVKRGYPKGYGDSLKIASTTDLKYHIKFQNTGSDTAIRVVIRDTISPLLDPQTVRPGASSHDYDFEVYDDGILKFTFNNIMLLDSSTNEAASHGFVKYRITQKPDNPEGSIIKNGAAIFFDYDVPLTTDSVCNIIGGMEWTDFIITSDREIYIPQTEIKIYPNPVSQFATFELEGPSIQPPLDFKVYDVAGKLVRSERFFETTFEFNRKNLPGGMYFYQISHKNQLISTGKIIAK